MRKKLPIILMLFLMLIWHPESFLVYAQQTTTSDKVTTKVGSPTDPEPGGEAVVEGNGGQPFTPLPNCVAARNVVPAIDENTYPGGPGELSTCGPAAATMVLQSLGINVSLEQTTLNWDGFRAWNHQSGFAGDNIPTAMNNTHSGKIEVKKIKKVDGANQVKQLIAETGNAVFLSVFYTNNAVGAGLDKQYTEGPHKSEPGGIWTSGIGHMIVVYQVCNDRVYIADPLGGEKYSVPIAQFNQVVAQPGRGEAFTTKSLTSNPPANQFIKPVRGLITTCFDSTNPPYSVGKKHAGLDIAAPAGTTIVAAAAGTVTANSYDGLNGNYAHIDIGGGKTTIYLHMLAKSPLQVGQHVNQGELVGQVGSTGESSGAHLHFQLNPRPNQEDPSRYFNLTNCVDEQTNF